MPAWLPLLKTTLPYVTQIVATAIPAFTSKPDASKADPVVTRQIEELQTAATRNAESIHTLAENFEQTVLGIDDAAARLQQEVNRLQKLVMLSSAASLVAVVVAVIALVR
ncbi:hypothetical protein HG264_15920 [Pseudomonas sp. gcc21]|uniref:hypothetical protein n=1 Tax=Pseudomonas sp. gcc21 TaxID=2726989 RepID=UPI00145152A7|nr:hypothetical protein [Pseudomonas sp. gcc21]QJD60260.1 hypothetical protein HG264_15920 [Pseudomonas sp. gcc21]